MNFLQKAIQKLYTNPYLGNAKIASDASISYNDWDRLMCSNGNKCGKDICDGDYNYYDLQYLHFHFPLVEHIANFKTDLIIGGGIKFISSDPSVSTEITAKVDEYLSRNDNLSALKTAIKEMLIYGHSGIRLLDYNGEKILQYISAFNFVKVFYRTEVKGYKKDAFYIVSDKDIKIDGKVDGFISKTDNGYLGIRETDTQFYLLPSEMVLLKANSDSDYGLSPLYYDRTRLQLVLDTLHANLEDVNNDGMGKLVLWLNENLTAESLGLSEMEATDVDKRTSRIAEIAKAIDVKFRTKYLGKENKNAIITLNKAHISELKQLDRNTKSIEYLAQIKDEGVVLICNAFGIHPALFMTREGGANAISIKPILDYTVNVLNTPMQDLLETQLLSRLKQFWNITEEGRLVFDRLDLSDPKSIAETNLLHAQTAEKLLSTGVIANDVYDYISNNVAKTETEDTERYLLNSYTNSDNINEDTIIQ